MKTDFSGASIYFAPCYVTATLVCLILKKNVVESVNPQGHDLLRVLQALCLLFSILSPLCEGPLHCKHTGSEPFWVGNHVINIQCLTDTGRRKRLLGAETLEKWHLTLFKEVLTSVGQFRDNQLISQQSPDYPLQYTFLFLEFILKNIDCEETVCLCCTRPRARKEVAFGALRDGQVRRKVAQQEGS